MSRPLMRARRLRARMTPRAPSACLVLLLVLSPPVAASGYHVDVLLFEDEESCRESFSSNETRVEDEHGYASWSASRYASGCERQHTTLGAAASDDDGELARADVGGDEGHADDIASSAEEAGERDADGNLAERSEGRNAHRGEAWDEEGARLAALGHGAHAGRVCRSESADTYFHAARSEPAHGRDARRFASRSDAASACEHGLHADLAGREAYAGATERCEQHGETSFAAESSAEGEHVERIGDHEDGCALGPEARAGGQGAAAGLRVRCERHDRDARHAPGEPAEESFAAGGCREGVGAEGPDGIRAFVGVENGFTRTCFDGACWDESGSAVVAESSWRHGPLGLGNAYVGLPLPTLP